MISPDYCQKMAAYNARMNERLYECCAALSDEERKADRALFFRSIHGTLNHLLYADMAWLSRFKQEAVDLPAMGEDLYSVFDELRRARRDWDRRISDWAASLSEQWLSRDYTYTSRMDGITRTHPNWLLAAHLFNHGTHHRGQVTAALSQLGVDYGSTDIPFLSLDS